MFDAASVRGALTIKLFPAALADAPVHRYALGGRFPEDGCSAIERPVSLALVPMGFDADTPQTLYETARSVWEARPFAAEWADGASTEISLRGAAPTHACQLGQQIYVHGSQRIETADDKVAFERRVVVWFGDDMYVDEFGFFTAIPAAEFEQATGMTGVSLEGGEYGVVVVRNYINNYNNGSSVSGSLTVQKWRGFELLSAAHPVLKW